MSKKIIVSAVYFLLFGELLFGQTRIDIEQNVHLVCTGAVQVVLEDTRFVNGGLFEAGLSTFKFTGSGFANITGSSFTKFHHLEIDKPGAVLYLEQDGEVGGDIIFQQGFLDLGFYDLYLLGQLSGESEISRLVGPNGGELIVEANLNIPIGVDPGNIGIEITSASDLGMTTIRRGHQAPASGSGQGIARYFDIDASNNGNLNATLKMNYFNAELGTVPENELEFWRSTDQGQNWTLEGFDNRDAGLNTVELAGIESFSRWTLGSATTLPLPLDLLEFIGNAIESGNLLEWRTTNETNVLYHEIERSELGQGNWELLDRMDSNPSGQYDFVDENPFLLTYYRIKFVDVDGSFDYSPVIAISREISSSWDWSFYPNPASDQIYIESQMTLSSGRILVIDVKGRVLKVIEGTTQTGTDWKVDIADLAAGSYYLFLQNGSQQSVNPLIKID